MGYRVLVFTTRFFFLSVFVSLSHSCPKGYYGSPCTPCPFSTYKDFSGDAASCKPCPTNSGHQRLGSIYIQDCRCLAGYEGLPEHGLACTIRRCALLSPPVNGAFQGNCFRVYSSECRMKCHEGYEAVGSMERKCVVNQNDIMVWSGTPMSCAVITCPFNAVPYADPPSGVCNSANLEYNTRCIFKCLTGYRLRGSKERVCQLDKTWSGTPTTCEEITCPKLSPVQPWVSLIPSECATGPMSFYSLCSFRCPYGFAVQGHPSSVAATSLLCQLNGAWSESVPTCYDYQPPQFLKCPGQSGSIVTETQKGKATAKVFWTVQVTDNSVREDPNAVIQVRSSHEPGQEFHIGVTSIRITATDQAGNSAWCAFSIDVKDTEPPSCSSCPADIVQEETTHEVRVYWKDPVCSDNSGNSPTISSSRLSGDIFRVPSSSIVQYTVSDGFNDNRNCSFRITLKEKSCPKRSPPRNGALACSTYASPVCAVFCKSGTDFEFNPPMLYYCSAGKWETYSFNGMGDKNIPNCSASASPSWIKMYGFPWYYYGGSGDANDPNVQAVIKSQFIALMKSSGLVPPIFCTIKPNCKEANISVTPGAIG